MGVTKLSTDTNTKFTSTSVYNFSWNHTLVANGGRGNRVIFVSVGGETADSNINPPWNVTGITYGGQPMSLLVKSVTSENGAGLSNNSAELWIIREDDLPANGVNTIAVTGTTTPGAQVWLFGVCAEYGDVDQIIAADTDGVSENQPVANDTIENSVDPNNADLIVSSYVCGNAGSWTVAEGQVEVYDQQNDVGPTNTYGVAELLFAPPGPYTISSTYVSGANRLTRCSASLVAWRKMNETEALINVNGVSRKFMGTLNGVL